MRKVFISKEYCFSLAEALDFCSWAVCAVIVDHGWMLFESQADAAKWEAQQ